MRPLVVYDTANYDTCSGSGFMSPPHKKIHYTHMTGVHDESTSYKNSCQLGNVRNIPYNYNVHLSNLR